MNRICSIVAENDIPFNNLTLLKELLIINRSFIISRIPRMGLAICLAWVCISCGPTTIDHQGHRIFNPNYLFYLETERRDKWQKPAEVLKALEISNTAVVADIGAGGGYFTEKFSKYLSPSGHVMPPMFKM